MALDVSKDRPNPYDKNRPRVIAAKTQLTDDQQAQRAAAATNRWWGPIDRQWAPDPYGTKNLQEWFRRHWAALPGTKPACDGDAL